MIRDREHWKTMTYLPIRKAIKEFLFVWLVRFIGMTIQRASQRCSSSVRNIIKDQSTASRGALLAILLLLAAMTKRSSWWDSTPTLVTLKVIASFKCFSLIAILFLRATIRARNWVDYAWWNSPRRVLHWGHEQQIKFTRQWRSWWL